MPVAEAIARLQTEIDARQVRQVVPSAFEGGSVAAVDSDAVDNEY